MHRVKDTLVYACCTSVMNIPGWLSGQPSNQTHPSCGAIVLGHQLLHAPLGECITNQPIQGTPGLPQSWSCWQQNFLLNRIYETHLTLFLSFKEMR